MATNKTNKTNIIRLIRLIQLKGNLGGWNKWREANPGVKIDLYRANLREVDLYRANLKGTNLRVADLKGASLIQASLKGADFYKANLVGADLYKANLERANLERANLERANLERANLRGANLRGANLREAKLIHANLSGVQALGTNFEGTTLTGTSIQDWNINSETNLRNVICDYIYLEEGQQERRPSNPNRNFEPGEFTKLFQIARETIDLVFLNGIDWKAFLLSLEDLQNEYGQENVDVQGIEKKSGGIFVVRIEVPPEVNKAEIESKAKQSYETKLKVMEAHYRAKLSAKDSEIAFYKEQGSNMMEIAKLAASRPITVEAKAVAENQSKNVEVEMNFQGSVTGAAGKVEGNQIINPSEEKQTLAEAAQEIQNLLKQLEQTNPTATVEQQEAFVNAAIPPTLKQRCVGAFKAGGETAIDEFLFQSPYAKVGVSVIKGWMNP